MSETPSNSNSKGGLSQDDFRKLLATPRHGASSSSNFSNFKTPRTVIKPPPTPSRVSVDSTYDTPNPYLSQTPRKIKIPSTPRNNGGFIKPSSSATKKAKKSADDASAYRDRAEERRRGENPDYIETEKILESINNIVGPDMTPSSTLSYEQSKYLGGDEKHTHLVKGLDYVLLAKQRSKENEEESVVTDDDIEKLYIQKQEVEETVVSNEAPRFMTGLGERIYKAAFSEKPIAPNKTDLFTPGRMAYVFELADEMGEYTNAFALPTTIIRSRNDLEDEGLLIQKDTASELVASKIGNLFAQHRLNPVPPPTLKSGSPSADSPEQFDEAVPVPVASDSDDNVFSDVGSEYELDLEAESVKEPKTQTLGLSKTQDNYFANPATVEESEAPVSYDLAQLVKQASEQVMSFSAMKAAQEENINSTPRSLFVEPPNFNQSVRVYLNSNKPEDDSGLIYGGSDSDEEPLHKELEVMDEGTSKNKRKQLSRWDFEDEEEWARYKEQQVHMPKAAFQFGVKSSEGRGHNKKSLKSGDKLNREYQQLKSFMDQKYNNPENRGPTKEKENSPKRSRKH